MRILSKPIFLFILAMGMLALTPFSAEAQKKRKPAKTAQKPPKNPQDGEKMKAEKDAQLDKDIKKLKKEYDKSLDKKTKKRMKRHRKKSNRHSQNKRDPFLKRLFQRKHKKGKRTRN